MAARAARPVHGQSGGCASPGAPGSLRKDESATELYDLMGYDVEKVQTLLQQIGWALQKALQPNLVGGLRVAAGFVLLG